MIKPLLTKEFEISNFLCEKIINLFKAEKKWMVNASTFQVVSCMCTISNQLYILGGKIFTDLNLQNKMFLLWEVGKRT